MQNLWAPMIIASIPDDYKEYYFFYDLNMFYLQYKDKYYTNYIKKKINLCLILLQVFKYIKEKNVISYNIQLVHVKF